MSQSLLERDHIIYNEMMSHPALFSHHQPRQILLVGDDKGGILEEVCKHNEIELIWHIASQESSMSDPRIYFFREDKDNWLSQVESEFFDIAIISRISSNACLKNYFRILALDGMLLQHSHSPFHLAEIKTLQETLLAAGFADNQLIHFPQPSFNSGWRAAFLSKKKLSFTRIREKDIFNKPFSTEYYNFDVHKGALVIPEFIKDVLSV